MQHRVCLYYKIPEIGEKLQHTESMPCVFFKYIFMLNYLWIYSSVHLYCIHIVVPNSCDSVQLNLSQMMLNLAKHMVLRLLWLQLRYLQKRTSYTFMYRVLWTVLLLLLFFFVVVVFLFCFCFVFAISLFGAVQWLYPELWCQIKLAVCIPKRIPLVIHICLSEIATTRCF